MEIKHIRWIAVVGLIAIVELQYVWLVNTYKLTKESIRMKGEELFPEAALQEVFLRVSKTKKDSTVTMNVNFDAEKDMETMSNPGQWLMSYMHVSFQEIALKDFNRDVSFVDLDSIYAHMLDSIGFPAVVASCIVDSTGRVMRSSSQLDIHGKGVLRTSPLPISHDGTRFLQGVITNPYRVIFQRMTLLLLATVLIMVLVIVCIIYQIRIIVRQDKIAKLREDFSYAMIHDMKTPEFLRNRSVSVQCRRCSSEHRRGCRTGQPAARSCQRRPPCAGWQRRCPDPETGWRPWSRPTK